MNTSAVMRNSNRKLTFEDLKNLRAEGYIRDSTLDQKDGFGPEMQRRASEGFARSYGLVLGNAWYTDFITGTSILKRSSFHQALADAKIDRFDVLLVYHTSRFARNRADAIRYKEELRKLGKILVFVSQGIISGNDNDFLNEGINEVLDEQYSRNLSRFVADGLRVKHDQGIANGVPPLGYKSEKLENGKRERKIPNSDGMPSLLALLRGYASGRYSYQALAENLNAQDYHNREGEPFSKGSVEHILSNRFYEGKVVYHPGEPDEEVRDGTHEVPTEVTELWQRCQEIKRERTRERLTSGPRHRRSYIFSGVARCNGCKRPYHGKPAYGRNGNFLPTLEHHIRRCGVPPFQVATNAIEREFDLRVLPHLNLDDGCKGAILACLNTGHTTTDKGQLERLDSALGKLRDLYLWGDIEPSEYQAKKMSLEQQRKGATARVTSNDTLDLDRAADLLKNLPDLWNHPGVTNSQRQELLKEVFEGIYLNGKHISAIKPNPQYEALFAYQVLSQTTVGREGSSPLAPTSLIP